jgi:hypothetical protein
MTGIEKIAEGRRVLEFRLSYMSKNRETVR